jgi:hypothetical protein
MDKDVFDDGNNSVGRNQRSRSEAYAWAQASISDEELDRRAAELGGKSLAQIFEQLEKL